MFADTDLDDEWLTQNIILWIKDNTPKSKNGRKAPCEFCDRIHDYKDDMCDIKTEEHSDANEMESAKVVTLQQLYD